MPGPAAIECFTFENICRPAPCTGSRVSRPAPAALQPRPLLAAAPDVSEYIRRGGFFSLRQESSHQKFPCGLRPPPSGGNALLQNYADGSVRDVFLCSGMGGNVRCRKGSPCSTRAKGSMYPRPARLRLRAAKPHEGSAPRTLSSAPRPPPCRLGRRRRERSEHGERSEGAVRLCLPRMVTSDERKKVSGGSSLHTPLTRRASGGQGCFQHYSTTERREKSS